MGNIKKKKTVKKGVLRIVQKKDLRFYTQIKKKSKNKTFGWFLNMFYTWMYLDHNGNIVKKSCNVTPLNKKRKAQARLDAFLQSRKPKGY